MVPTFRSDVRNPQTAPPLRRPRSARRTTTIDIDDHGTLHLVGRCRDLVTDSTGEARVHGRAELTAVLARGHVIERIDASAEQETIATLVGTKAGRGFRAAAAAALPEHAAAADPLFVLLDELPVAALISGFGLMYSGALADHRLDGGSMKPDICSGWASDGVMMTSITATGFMPVPQGPEAPSLQPLDDPLAWHPFEPLAPGRMRRCRMIDVHVADTLVVSALFRDTYRGAADADVESVLHEYAVTAEIDAESLTVTSCVAEPRVLPWNECPSAAASAGRLVGSPVDHLRDLVGREFRGLGTCTHLNDLLRALGDLQVLVPLALAADGPG